MKSIHPYGCQVNEDLDRTMCNNRWEYVIVNDIIKVKNYMGKLFCL